MTCRGPFQPQPVCDSGGACHADLCMEEDKARSGYRHGRWEASCPPLACHMSLGLLLHLSVCPVFRTHTYGTTECPTYFHTMPIKRKLVTTEISKLDLSTSSLKFLDTSASLFCILHGLQLCCPVLCQCHLLPDPLISDPHPSTHPICSLPWSPCCFPVGPTHPPEPISTTGSFSHFLSLAPGSVLFFRMGPSCFQPVPLTSLSSAELKENNPLNGAVAWPVQTNPCKILDAKLQLISTEAVWNWNFSHVYNVPKFGHLFSRIARGTCWHTQHHLCQMSCPAP